MKPLKQKYSFDINLYSTSVKSNIFSMHKVIEYSHFPTVKEILEYLIDDKTFFDKNDVFNIEIYENGHLNGVEITCIHYCYSHSKADEYLFVSNIRKI